MSYGVALRNGVPFTLGTIAALCVNATSQAFNPLVLWPDGIATPGMWSSPRTLTSEWADYTGTTPVATPGTVADSVNPVGLALDIRAGAPEVLGPELVVNGDGSSTTGWGLYDGTGTISSVGGRLRFTAGGTVNGGISQTVTGLTVGTAYQYDVTLDTLSNPSTYIYLPASAGFPGGGGFNTIQTYPFIFVANATSFVLVVRFAGGVETAGDYFEVDNISVREVPGNHMLQSTSAARPLLSAYDGQTLGPGDTYDSAGYPVFQLYDGVDDGMATAAFAAGTLIDGMDCMIVVRRDSDSNVIMGLISADTTRYFGRIYGGDLGSTAINCGTPTVLVDGAEITNTSPGLRAAMTVGDCHILEYQNLDLSAFTGTSYGGTAFGMGVNGARGDIMLYPSTTPTTDKDAARQWLADYYGVTLP